MRVKKVVKKLVALGTGITMLGATIMGAAAADLSEYPAPFVVGGAFNAIIVLGDGANAADTLGAIDIATNLQAEMSATKTVAATGASTVSVSEGAEVKGVGDDLNYMEALDLGTSKKFSKTDLPDLLADGTVTNEDTNEDFNYDQKIELGSQKVRFYNPDDDVFDVPIIALDTKTTAVSYTLVVDFDSALDATGLNNSEPISIGGTDFTFSADTTTGELEMYAAEETVSVAVGETKTMTLEDGTTVTVTLVGANTETDKATITVNGKTKSVDEGDTIMVGDTSVYIKDIFTYTVPTPGAAVQVSVGSEKIDITADSTWNNPEIDDDALETVEVNVTNNASNIDKIHFRISPKESDIDADEYLEIGESYLDPFFGTFEMTFGGMTPDTLDSSEKTQVSLDRAGDTYKLTFTNNDAEEYSFDVLYTNDTLNCPIWAEDFHGAMTDRQIMEDEYFILEEGSGRTAISKVLELKSVKTEDSIAKADIKDLSDGTTATYKLNDEIGDTGTTIVAISTADDYINISTDLLNRVWTNFEGNLTFRQATGDCSTGTNTSIITFEEQTSNRDETEVSAKLITFTVGNATSDEDIRLDYTTGLNDTAYDEDNNYQYGVTEYGTYVVIEEDNDGASMDLYYPEEETDFHIFINPTGAVVTSTAAGEGAVTYQEVVPIEVGYAVLASEAGDVTMKNAIVVGGPCANAAAAKLMGNPADCTAGFESGKAKIKLFDNDPYVAMLVAGYSADDTRRAARVVAKHTDYAAQLTGMEVEVTGTSFTDISVGAPTVMEEESTESATV